MVCAFLIILFQIEIQNFSGGNATIVFQEGTDVKFIVPSGNHLLNYSATATYYGTVSFFSGGPNADFIFDDRASERILRIGWDTAEAIGGQGYSHVFFVGTWIGISIALALLVRWYCLRLFGGKSDFNDHGRSN